MLAYEDRDRGRNEENVGLYEYDDDDEGRELLLLLRGPRACAIYDSRPELKANEPSGSAESDKSRR